MCVYILIILYIYRCICHDEDFYGGGDVFVQTTLPVLRAGQATDVNELIQATRTEQGFIQELWSIGGADEENVLLGTHTIDLGQ